jgi:hypothetical protein
MPWKYCCAPDPGALIITWLIIQEVRRKKRGIVRDDIICPLKVKYLVVSLKDAAKLDLKTVQPVPKPVISLPYIGQ